MLTALARRLDRSSSTGEVPIRCTYVPDGSHPFQPARNSS